MIIDFFWDQKYLNQIGIEIQILDSIWMGIE